jgi:hypothetical protein
MNKTNAGILLIIMLIAMTGLIQACVKASPSYEVLSLKMTPTTIITGEKVTVEAEVENTNSETDTYTIPLMIDGVADSRKTVTLDPGQTEVLTFELTRNHTGVYKVMVGGKESVLTVVQPSPAEFHLSDLQINPTQVDVGEDVVISAKLTNAGDSQGIYTAVLKIDGFTNQVENLTVPAGTDQTMVFKIIKGLPGTYNVTIGNLSGQFVVNTPPTPVFNVPIKPPAPPPNEVPCGPRG